MLPLCVERSMGMLPANSEYYRQRAVAERKRAKDAATPEIAAIHEEMAREYDELVERPEMQGMLRAFG